MAATPMCSMLSAIAGLNALLAKLNVSTARSVGSYIAPAANLGFYRHGNGCS